MQHVVGLQAFHQLVGDQFVVRGRLKVLGDVLKRDEEAAEIRVLVQPLRLCECGAFEAMAVLNFYQQSWVDCALQMQMQFGFRQRPNEGAGRRVREKTHNFDG